MAADLVSADPAALQPAVAGADAVLSAIGPRTKADVAHYMLSILDEPETFRQPISIAN